jgi:dihydrofolate reductase
MGHPILMGRKTAEAIGRPLPGRTNLVLSRETGLEIPGYVTLPHPDAALAWADQQNQSRLFVIGGAQVYQAFMPHADVLHITEINAELVGDTYFPEFNALDWKKAGHLFAPADSKNAYDLAFTRWERI